jgi:predicted patatin/cPLA2 family phospholipase
MMTNSCIVLEGGGMRSAFTSGVLEYFLEKDFHFDRIIGVSAGACAGASYISGQKGRNWKVNVEFPSDKRFMGFYHLITKGSYFNIPFIFGEIPEKLVPFDEQAVFENPVGFDIVITSLATGKSVVFTKKDIARISMSTALIASSSIPIISQPVPIDGRLFYDGGVADSIPAKYALTKHAKAVVVLTRPRGYRKGKTKNSRLIKFAFRKHPEFMKAMLNRNDEYNNTLDFCDQMEKEGKLFLIAPSGDHAIGRTESSLKKRADLYDHGYKLILEKFDEMKAFLK